MTGRRCKTNLTSVVNTVYLRLGQCEYLDMILRVSTDVVPVTILHPRCSRICTQNQTEVKTTYLLYRFLYCYNVIRESLLRFRVVAVL